MECRERRVDGRTGKVEVAMGQQTHRNQEPDQSGMGDLTQIQTRVDIKNYMHLPRLFDATVSPTLLRSGNVTQDAPTPYPDKKGSGRILGL